MPKVEVGNRRCREGLAWVEAMIAYVESLPPDEHAELDAWDKSRPDGVGTSDWPGFDKYLAGIPGRPPRGTGKN